MPQNNNITITQTASFPEAVFEVVIGNGEGTTKHIVRVEEEYYWSLTGGAVSPEELVRKSFEFLLEREPKESILRRFNLRDINRYFPEYEEKISKI